MVKPTPLQPLPPAQPRPDAWVTVGELAAALDLTRSSLLRAEAAGRLPAAEGRDGHGWRRWPLEVALCLEVARALAPMRSDPAVDHVAGIVMDGAEEGRAAARAALSVLDGDDLSRLPPTLSTRVLDLLAGQPPAAAGSEGA